MRDVEVHVTPHRDGRDPEQVQRQQVAIAEDCVQRGIVDHARGPQPHHHRLPPRPLHNAETPVPQVVCHVPCRGVGPLEVLAAGHLEDVESDEEESVVREGHRKVEKKPPRDPVEGKPVLGRLEVVRRHRVQQHRHGQPHQVGRHEDVPQGRNRRHRLGQPQLLQLGGVPGGESGVHPAGERPKDTPGRHPRQPVGPQPHQHAVFGCRLGGRSGAASPSRVALLRSLPVGRHLTAECCLVV
mmetsp:Transcript_27556/g.72447  ORF Transcript_27556/g.72447 Transcript_27556/m.72447 type:complete len:241 (-) Transcript_27556:16-738(-)